VHGANRLASNSLLDGLVFAPRIVEAIAAGKDGPEATGVLRGAPLEPGSVHDVPARPEGSMTLAELQLLMTTGAGVLRTAPSLRECARHVAIDVGAHDAASYELRNLLTVARSLVASALAREESRGTHTRLDFPETSAALAGRFFGAGDDPTFVPLPAEVRA
jgi:L-aspartate oxidase